MHANQRKSLTAPGSGTAPGPVFTLCRPRGFRPHCSSCTTGCGSKNLTPPYPLNGPTARPTESEPRQLGLFVQFSYTSEGSVVDGHAKGTNLSTLPLAYSTTNPCYSRRALTADNHVNKRIQTPKRKSFTSPGGVAPQEVSVNKGPLLNLQATVLWSRNAFRMQFEVLMMRSRLQTVTV